MDIKQIFDWLREQMEWNQTVEMHFDGTPPKQYVEREKWVAVINEAEAKWESELRKHEIEVHNKAISEFEEQMKFEYRESVGTTKRERHFAEAVIEQVAHSLTEVQ